MNSTPGFSALDNALSSNTVNPNDPNALPPTAPPPGPPAEEQLPPPPPMPLHIPEDPQLRLANRRSYEYAILLELESRLLKKHPSLVVAVCSFDGDNDGKLSKDELGKMGESVGLEPEDVWQSLIHFADFEVNSDDEDVSPRKLSMEEVEKELGPPGTPTVSLSDPAGAKQPSPTDAPKDPTINSPPVKSRYVEDKFGVSNDRIAILEFPTHLYVREVVDRIQRAPPAQLLSQEMQKELQNIVDKGSNVPPPGATGGVGGAGGDNDPVFKSAAQSFGMGMSPIPGQGDFDSARREAGRLISPRLQYLDEDTAFGCLVRCGEGQFRRMFKMRDSLGTTMLGVAASRGWIRVAQFLLDRLLPPEEKNLKTFGGVELAEDGRVIMKEGLGPVEKVELVGIGSARGSVAGGASGNESAGGVAGVQAAGNAGSGSLQNSARGSVQNSVPPPHHPHEHMHFARPDGGYTHVEHHQHGQHPNPAGTTPRTPPSQRQVTVSAPGDPSATTTQNQNPSQTPNASQPQPKPSPPPYKFQDFKQNTENLYQYQPLSPGQQELVLKRKTLTKPVVDYVNTPNDMVWTPLLIASAAGDYNLCELLLDHGANPDKVSKTSNLTALMMACSSGNYDVCEVLVRKKADVWLCNAQGLTAIEILKSKKLKNEQELRFSVGGTEGKKFVGVLGHAHGTAPAGVGSVGGSALGSARSGGSGPFGAAVNQNQTNDPSGVGTAGTAATVPPPGTTTSAPPPGGAPFGTPDLNTTLNKPLRLEASPAFTTPSPQKPYTNHSFGNPYANSTTSSHNFNSPNKMNKNTDSLDRYGIRGRRSEKEYDRIQEMLSKVYGNDLDTFDRPFLKKIEEKDVEFHYEAGKNPSATGSASASAVSSAR